MPVSRYEFEYDALPYQVFSSLGDDDYSYVAPTEPDFPNISRYAPTDSKQTKLLDDRQIQVFYKIPDRGSHTAVGVFLQGSVDGVEYFGAMAALEGARAFDESGSQGWTISPIGLTTTANNGTYGVTLPLIRFPYPHLRIALAGNNVAANGNGTVGVFMYDRV